MKNKKLLLSLLLLVAVFLIACTKEPATTATPTTEAAPTNEATTPTAEATTPTVAPEVTPEAPLSLSEMYKLEKIELTVPTPLAEKELKESYLFSKTCYYSDNYNNYIKTFYYDTNKNLIFSTCKKTDADNEIVHTVYSKVDNYDLYDSLTVSYLMENGTMQEQSRSMTYFVVSKEDNCTKLAKTDVSKDLTKQEEEYTFDSNGLLIMYSSTSEGGMCTKYEYNDKAQLTKISSESTTVVVTTLTYDEKGNKTLETTIEYDKQGNKASEIEEKIEYLYNEDGRLASSVCHHNEDVYSTTSYKYELNSNSDIAKIVEETKDNKDKVSVTTNEFTYVYPEN